MSFCFELERRLIAWILTSGLMSSSGRMAMEHAAAELIRINPSWKAIISNNSKSYQAQLAELDQATKLQIAELSKSNQA